MYITEYNTVNYISCLFFIYCFFVYTPVLHHSKKRVITYKRGLENKIHKLVYGKLLYTEDLSELLEIREKREQDSKKNPRVRSSAKVEQPVSVEKYEDKYLEKFKKFPNTFLFTEDELAQEKTVYDKLKNTYDANMKKDIHNCQEKIAKYQKKIESMEPIMDALNNTDKLDGTHLAVKLLIQYHEIEEEFEEDPDDFDLDELFNDFKNEYNDVKTDYNELTTSLDRVDKCRTARFYSENERNNYK